MQANRTDKSYFPVNTGSAAGIREKDRTGVNWQIAVDNVSRPATIFWESTLAACWAGQDKQAGKGDFL